MDEWNSSLSQCIHSFVIERERVENWGHREREENRGVREKRRPCSNGCESGVIPLSPVQTGRSGSATLTIRPIGASIWNWNGCQRRCQLQAGASAAALRESSGGWGWCKTVGVGVGVQKQSFLLSPWGSALTVSGA